jgi:beta-lactamase superfamily II metal-dependent hydrolase
MMRLTVKFGCAGLLLLAGLAFLDGCTQKDTTVYEVDRTPPAITDISEADGRVSWVTDEDALCMLTYGTRQGLYKHYGYNVGDGGRQHHVDLIDIQPGAYYLRVVATDAAGNSSTSEEFLLDIEEVPETENLVYTVVEVGWGDCNFLEFPGGTNVMVDAGWGDLIGGGHDLRLASFLQARGGPRIDYMIATHSHSDHWGGFLGLFPLHTGTTFLAPAESYSSVWWTLVDFDNLYSMEDVLDQYGMARDSLRTGQTDATEDFLNWDEEHAVEVKVLSSGAGLLFPPEQGEGGGEEGALVNNDSVVLMVSYGEVDILLTADAEEFVEHRMIKAYGLDINCEILKVGHHGGRDATTDQFLRYTTPRVGLISNSMEENDGMFSQEVINRLRGRLVDYYVTDHAYPNAGRFDDPEYGNLTVTTDGETFIVWAWRQ